MRGLVETFKLSLFFLAAQSPSHAKLVVMFLQCPWICLNGRLAEKGHWQRPQILTKNKKELGLVARVCLNVFETIVSFIQYLDSGMPCPVPLMSSSAFFFPQIFFVVRSLGAPQPYAARFFFFSPAPVGMQRRADRLQGEVAGLLLGPRVAARLFERADEGEKQ